MTKQTQHLATLTTALNQRRLLLVWTDVPFPPADLPPSNPALTINRWQDEVPALPADPLLQPDYGPARFSLAALPSLPILTLDPTDRLETAFRRAGVPFKTVCTQHDLPIRDRHSILKLGGDLSTRTGLLLSWDDVRAAPSDPDKAHLLREVRRLAQDSAVLVLAPSPTDVFARLWAGLLAPALRGAAHHFVLGSAVFSWPSPLVWLEAEPAEILAALSQVELEPLPPLVHTSARTLRLVRQLNVPLTPNTVQPPVQPHIQHLPFNELSWEQFEALCAALIEADLQTIDCHLYGVRGDDQQGIDVVATQRGAGKDGANEIWAYQCKRYRQYTPTNLEKAIAELTYRADYYVLMLSIPAAASLRHVVEEKPNIFIWDANDIARKLKDYPAIVEDFFGPAWRTAFCR
jgi:hypothetical protein